MSGESQTRGHDVNGASRRAVLKSGVAAMAAGVAALAAGVEQAHAQPPNKVTQKVAHYQDHPNGNAQCSKCVNFIAPNSCKIVQGTISPNGWCLLFAPKPA